MLPYAIKQPSSSVFRLDHVVDSPDWEQWYLLSSDWHFDNPKCRQDLLFADLEKAKKRNAGIFCFGDLFCAMQGAKDRRGSKSAIRPEHLGSDYFDRLVNDATEKLLPYAQNFVLFGQGNHETAILRHNETDLLERLSYRLHKEGESPVLVGGYSGYVWFQFKYRKTVSARKVLKFHHGYGGGAAVTKGAIQQQRAAVMFPSADILYMGHNHQRQATHHPQEILNTSGRVVTREQAHLRGATYKDAWGDGSAGWEVEKGFGPTALGGWWLRFFLKGREIGYEYVMT